MADLEASIRELWEQRATLHPDDVEARETIEAVIDLLDRGELRCAEVRDGDVVVHDWVKLAILLLFRISEMTTVDAGPFEYLDKIPLKADYADLRVRVVPGAIARWGSYLAPGVTLMPSFVNVGAYVGADTMIDTWATVGSCAQVGARVHLSGGVGIGGVLEPPQAAPVIIEDDAFIGSRCVVVEGARVGAGAKLGAGLILTASTPVIDAQTGAEVSRGVVPPRAVVVPATRARQFAGGAFDLACALVLRTLDEGEIHDKTVLNDILREHGVAQ